MDRDRRIFNKNIEIRNIYFSCFIYAMCNTISFNYLFRTSRGNQLIYNWLADNICFPMIVGVLEKLLKRVAWKFQ